MRKVGLLALEAQRSGGLLAVEDMMDALDSEFAKVTQVEQNSEIRAALEAISVTTQSPSAMIAEVRVLLQARYSLVAAGQRKDLVESDLRSFVMEKVQKGAEAFAWMKPFQQKLTDADFLGKDLDQWSRQFRILEQAREYTEGVAAAAAAGGSADLQRGRGPRVSRTHTINAIDDDSEDEGGSGGASGGSGVAALGVQVAALADMVRALGTVPRQRPDWRSPEWVVQYGVIGYPAPADRSRPDVKVGEIWRRAGVAIPEGCPTEPSSMVGHLCPCNARRGIPRDMWFWHHDARQFAGDPRRPPAGVRTGWAYMHRIGKCSLAYEEGHKLGRADPAANGRLLDALPAGAMDCIGA
jgi:hypothetical protein